MMYRRRGFGPPLDPAGVIEIVRPGIYRPADG
jgi:hypothetical protein